MRHFPPGGANAALVEVGPLVEQMVARRSAHLEALERQEQLEGHIRGNGGGIPPAQLADASAEIDGEAREPPRLADAHPGPATSSEGSGGSPSNYAPVCPSPPVSSEHEPASVRRDPPTAQAAYPHAPPAQPPDRPARPLRRAPARAPRR